MGSSGTQPHDWREWRRMRALDLAQLGWKQRDIAVALDASDLSFGLFQDPETPENRGFLVYLGLLGLRGSSGTARKQPESTKLGPRKSESLVRTAWGRFGRLPEAALPGVEGHRADAQSPAELGDREVALLLALDLAAPPFTPCLASCRRSESEHELSPGDEKLDSGIEAIMRAKAGRAVRLRGSRIDWRAV